jgi:hypothetical protein
VPKSRVRKKKVYTPPTEVRPSAPAAARKKRPSPRWVPGLASGLIVAGIAWLATYYMTQASFPVEQWGVWNLAVGFGLMVASLGVFTQWR